jgi:hypothetical protein
MQAAQLVVVVTQHPQHIVCKSTMHRTQNSGGGFRQPKLLLHIADSQGHQHHIVQPCIHMLCNIRHSCIRIWIGRSSGTACAFRKCSHGLRTCGASGYRQGGYLRP